jgi:hypothetical protein
MSAYKPPFRKLDMATPVEVSTFGSFVIYSRVAGLVTKDAHANPIGWRLFANSSVIGVTTELVICDCEGSFTTEDLIKKCYDLLADAREGVVQHLREKVGDGSSGWTND